MKQCTKCNEFKDLEFFTKNSQLKSGRASICKACSSKATNEYNKKNRDKCRLNNERWMQSNPDKFKECQIRYNQSSHDRRKHILAEHHKRYVLKNRGKVNAKNMRRHAAKMQRTPMWLTKDHFKQIQEFYIHAHVLTVQSGIPYHVDHIIPLQGENVSGLHVPWNMQVITAHENVVKSNKLIQS